MSSSGFVPLPDSNREEKVKGPSQAPLPSFMVPPPSLSVPFHSAVEVLTAIRPSVPAGHSARPFALHYEATKPERCPSNAGRGFLQPYPAQEENDRIQRSAKETTLIHVRLRSQGKTRELPPSERDDHGAQHLACLDRRLHVP